MELRKIRMDDILTNPKNPRRDFGDLDALAATFELNRENPGEPINPIVVVQDTIGYFDGRIQYHIVDGERRYRAMEKLHGKDDLVSAIVCDDMNEANVMVSMLTTDDKAPLTEAEKSNGVQQMLLLGVPFEHVEKAAKLKKGQAAKVNLGAALAGEGSKQMSLDQCMAFAEFEGDSDALEELRKAKDWRKTADSLRDKRKKKELEDALLDECSIAGIALSEDPGYGDYTFVSNCFDPESLAEEFAELPEGSVAVYADDWQGPHIRFMRPREERVESPEEAERKRREAELDEAMACTLKRHREWYAGHLDGTAPSTDALMAKRYFCGSWDADRRRENAEEVAGKGADVGWCTGMFAAHVFAEGYEHVSAWCVIKADETRRRRMEMWAEQLDAFVADGYELTEADVLVSDAIAERLSESEDDSDGDE